MNEEAIAIGGYLELELPQGKEYHVDAIRLNSGRHCLEYILRLRQYRKVFIPYYTCDVLLQPLHRLGLNYEFYRIDERMEPIFKFESLSPDECFLYINYFGLKDAFIDALPQLSNIIIDNSQAFFSKPLPHFDTFYSPRKFFGVPDGGYLFHYDKEILEIDLPLSGSYERCSHLLKRIDISAEAGYADFRANSILLADEALMQMSKLTRRILSSIDYEQISQRRMSNFKLYHAQLKPINRLPLSLFEEINSGPLIYPLVTQDKNLRDYFISKKIYVPQYWSNVLIWSSSDSLEFKLTQSIIPLPVDQHLDETNIDVVITALKKYIL